MTKSRHNPVSTTLALLAAALLAAVVVLLGAAPGEAAPAQTDSCDDIYGCPPPPPPPGIDPQCSLSSRSAEVGAQITATITNIPVGTEVTLHFDGTEVGKETATADGQGQTALAALTPVGHLSVSAPAQDASGGVVMTFRVPNTTPGSDHTVVFSGAGFSCDATGGQGFEVAGGSIARPGGGGSLSDTGIEVGIYLAIALVLLLAGTQFVRMARARRRRIERRSEQSRRRHLVR